ncbi:hypothetical protein RRG08_050048 [Elysia crispata]|uniref:Uncharacterized protein n=1 Tax=Elysia crispata TaxID=231223 RepID=A0AAE1B9R0_9GAST|nr:hypothetical protein RRG08_050048 [Elysia crispata]
MPVGYNLPTISVDYRFFHAFYNQLGRRQRDEQLMTIILQTMRNDRNVLVAVDTAGLTYGTGCLPRVMRDGYRLLSHVELSGKLLTWRL